LESIVAKSLTFSFSYHNAKPMPASVLRKYFSDLGYQPPTRLQKIEQSVEPARDCGFFPRLWRFPPGGG